MNIASTGTPLLYLGFTVLVVALLAADFLLLKAQGAHRVGVREAAAWSVVWIAIALAFCGWFWWYLDARFPREVANQKALEYLTGYLIEKSLAVDNVFVWITLFGFFAIPPELQKRVLLYGVLGAIVMRAILIYVGALLLARFHWILYVFGLLLVVTGVKMLVFAKDEPDLQRNPVLRWMRGHLKITDEHHGEKFFVAKNGVRYATPLFVVLVLVELTDLIFAVDSIPAIFAVTGDPFIVFTSNIFAILGLRAMYFLLAETAKRFHLLKYGLAAILMFIGAKMLLLDVYKIPVMIALGVIGLILLASVVASIWHSRRAPPRARIVP
ncbi:TerC family protein [Ramlibacter sp.]|uniref:TerC family protein n=1 Tax=Ramlibacter sp. TaxID=1917967 RepID=UPI002CBAB49C|nr:TerC family protein [Ramlibacter sp.]HWI80678.1 TerC family protein [Ramlibacter sp.]